MKVRSSVGACCLVPMREEMRPHISGLRIRAYLCSGSANPLRNTSGLTCGRQSVAILTTSRLRFDAVAVARHSVGWLAWHLRSWLT